MNNYIFIQKEKMSIKMRHLHRILTTYYIIVNQDFFRKRDAILNLYNIFDV